MRRLSVKYLYDQYVSDVLSGKQVACQWVKLACERHVRDMHDGADRGITFDWDAANKVIAFCSLLKQSKGEWAGQPLNLQPWQQFILASIFGWKRHDGTRRYRTAILEVARKAGKSTLASAVGLYMLVADGEGGAEIYSAATMRAQAQITHGEATRMVKSSPQLGKIVRIFKDNIFIEDTASKFIPLGADSDTMDGLNVHCAIVDEIHAHKTRDTWDLLETATGARRQPLMFGISTAGYDRQSLFFTQHEYTQKVLSGVIENDAWFGIIYTQDDGDDWQNESLWIKSNPNLGVSKKMDNMQELAARAKEMPSALNSFQRLHLDMWTQVETIWLPVEHWKLCNGAVDAEGLRGRTCYGGLDLSSTTDITALVLVFPPQADEDAYQVLCHFYLPDETMKERVRRDRVPYDAWARQGYLTLTPGNTIDYDWIVAQVDKDMQAYDLSEIAFDRWGASRIQTQLQDLGGKDFLVQFGQGFASMSPAMKRLETLILSHRIAYGNNPILNWMCHNVVATVDPAGNQKPDKSRSREKIDGIVALMMALDRADRHTSNDSVFGTGEMIIL
jgi:phage terminase large subunit-like protein